MSFLNKSDVKNHLSTRSGTLRSSWAAKSQNANGLETNLSDDKRNPSGPRREPGPALLPPITPVDTLIPSDTDAAVTGKLRP